MRCYIFMSRRLVAKGIRSLETSYSIVSPLTPQILHMVAPLNIYTPAYNLVPKTTFYTCSLSKIYLKKT
jgi:hypothetical protein